MNRNLLKWFSPLLALAIFLVALWALNRALGQYNFSDILQQLHRLPRTAILAALVLTVASHLLLTSYDHLAMRYLGRKLPPARVTLASFSSYAFSHNVGFSLLTGGSIRYRMYSSWGLSAEEIARLTAFAAFSFVLGVTTVGSLLLLFSPADLPHFPFLPLKDLWPLAAVGLSVPTGYLVLVAARRRPVRLRGWQIPLPSLRYGIGQIVLGSAEWMLTGSVLYPLLPPAAGLSLPEFLQIYLLAQLVAMFSHVPGGLGVFETVFLLLVPAVPPPALFGSLLVYRTIYYLLPFGLAILLLAGFEAMRQRKRARRAGAAVGQSIAASAPLLLAAGTLAAGALLLFSAVIPRDADGWRLLAAWLPSPLPEIGSLLAAAVGAGLLLVARGLQLRLHTAWQIASILLVGGAVLSLAAGSGLLAVAVCGLVLAGLLPSGELFHRLRPLRDEPFTPWWIALILIIHATAVWLGVFSLPEVGFPPTMVDYSTEAARILRAEFAAALVLLFFAVAKQFRRGAAVATSSDAASLARATTLAARESSSFGHLLLHGDKRLLFGPTGDAFLMYAERERSLVSLGEPVGPAAQRAELPWRFRELCERTGKWPVFFAIGGETSAVCLEMGMALQPVGREGTIPLAEFSPVELDGRVGNLYRNALENGCLFEIVGGGEEIRLRPELERIVGDGKDRKRDGGGLLQDAFAPTLIGRFPIALVRRQGTIVAFASLPSANSGADLILGFCRIAPEGPPGSAEFLVVNICLWGREAGLSRFNLGIVPFAAEPGDPLSASWQRLAPGIFPHGDLFASSEELRAFKESFRPRWQSPLCLACPEALLLPEILADIAGKGEGGDG